MAKFRHRRDVNRVVDVEPGTNAHARLCRLVNVWEPVEDPEPEPEPDTPELDDVTDAGPVHVGGGWYEYPDGTKVRGNPEDG